MFSYTHYIILFVFHSASLVIWVRNLGSCKILLVFPDEHHTCMYDRFMKGALHVCKSVPDGIVQYELGRVPVQHYWHKMILKYVSSIF